MDKTLQIVLEYITVLEGVLLLLLQVLCIAGGELYIVIDIGVLITILKPNPCDWVFTFLVAQDLMGFA